MLDAELAEPVARAGTALPSMLSRSDRQLAVGAATTGATLRPGMPNSAIATGAATVSPVDSRVASWARTPVTVTRIRRPVITGKCSRTVAVEFSGPRSVMGGSRRSRAAPSTWSWIEVGTECRPSATTWSVICETRSGLAVSNATHCPPIWENGVFQAVAGLPSAALAA